MNFGYACIPLGTKYKTTRKFLLKNYSEDILKTCIENNLSDLLNILKYNVNNDIHMFRVSSDIIPFASHTINTFPWMDIFKEKLLSIGNFAKENNIRLSMHPGQYTVLNTPDKTILEKSISDLTYHCNFLDSLGIDKKNKLILHIGGVYGEKDFAIERFISACKNLDTKIIDRLIIENDEKNYSLYDVINISHKTNLPVVLDNLHFFCKEQTEPSLNDFKLAFNTWDSSHGIPKVHYSQQALNKKIGSHSNTISIPILNDYLNLTSSYNFDIMLEVKDKDFSAFKSTNLLLNNRDLDNLNKEFNRYKYFLLEYSKEAFEKGHDILFNKSFLDFYNFLDILKTTHKNNSMNSYKLFIEEYLNLSSSEENYLKKLFLNEDIAKIKAYLLKLSLRSSSKNILQNYFLFF
ncbi:MAG: UV DNA damage repair endonuclease UvsE [Clostridium sp.]|uniref:UV DNA damage repair endonuclease UvsE n=1 Tax=Clostridium sp. TaxID=1506 RepID=UPI003EE74B5D